MRKIEQDSLWNIDGILTNLVLHFDNDSINALKRSFENFKTQQSFGDLDVSNNIIRLLRNYSNRKI